MAQGLIMALVLAIAPQYDVPPYLVMAIIAKDSKEDLSTINHNDDGTIDRGLMQLNFSWFNDENWENAEVNLRAGIRHLQYLYDQTRNTSPNWWLAVIAYHSGLDGIKAGKIPPNRSIQYAEEVFKIWNNIDPWRGVYRRMEEF